MNELPNLLPKIGISILLENLVTVINTLACGLDHGFVAHSHVIMFPH